MLTEMVMAVHAAPINPSSTADAIKAGADVVKDLSGHQYTAAFATLLMILGWVLKQPWAGNLFAKIPAKFRALAMALGGGLATAGVLYEAGGMSLGQAVLTGLMGGLGASGLWEIIDGLIVTPHNDAKDLQKKLDEVNKITDPNEKAKALADLMNTK